MAHVLTHWRFPDEETRFFDYLEKTGDILACTAERMSEPSSERLEPRPIRQLIAEQDPEALLMGPREFMDMAGIQSFELNSRISYGRYYMCVPLVHYRRGGFRSAQRLGLSNLVFESTRSNGDLDDPIWIAQPPAFIAWAKRVLGWARRHAPRVVAHKRMSERVFAALGEGLELVP